MPDYLQAIRDCCRDEAAFERLKHILAAAVRDEAFELLLGSLDSNFSTNASSLPDIICQFPKQNCLESDSLKAITRISGYEEDIIGCNTINIVERKGVQVWMRSLFCDRPFPHPLVSQPALCSTRLLGEMALRIRKSLNLDRILNTTVEEVRQFLQADRVFIGCIDERSNGEILAESVAHNCQSIKGWRLDENYVREIKSFYEHRHPRVINDTNKIEKTPFLSEYYTRYQVKAGLGVPIIVGEEFFGVLVANQCSSPRCWQPFEIDLLEKLATQVAIAIQQAQLYKQVQTLNTKLEYQVEERTVQLQQRNRDLQELNRIKDVLLHTVSHDLRTSVMGTLMILKNWLNLPGENISIPRKLLERMVSGSDRQLKTIDSVLETNASEAQGTIIHREFIQFSTVLPSIIKDLQPMLAQNQATLINLVPEDLPLVMLDPTQIQRVFESLLAHTLKHNPPGLSLTLSATVEAGMIRCHIQDNGVGIGQVECDRIFDLYVRDPQARCSTGIGLKLYLCRQIITAHGGQIGVISKPGEGSTYWFTLPVK
ncbi:GAF domain-containing sensor histidine kinase [Argonema antarcticum]|uniref:GAF domain-containing sensor histidine kinase n=1 Tax=Argonema antarcticum TaxID=2942763 RepID=UPI0020117D40|nr:GAF domain-containing sensor histidine kinase [Argonema antarcticum]MCL1470194.1 GAF domain-containing sensor histidine kinase [Argonema antarcticum A004/B2]